MRSKSLFGDAGNILVMFALAAPVAIAAAGVAIDYTRAATAKTDLQQSLDAASQTLSQQVAACIESAAAGGPGACVNDAAFIAQVIAQAQPLLAANYRQRGYDGAPTIVGTPTLNPATNIVTLEATAGYPCIFVKLVSGSTACSVGVGAAGSLRDQLVPPLSIAGPASLEFWLDQPMHDLPAQYTASGGTPAYLYRWGGSDVEGLTLDPASGALTGPATGPVACATPTCDPEIRAPLAVGVLDEGAPQQQRAQTATAVTLVHPLTLRFAPQADGSAATVDSTAMTASLQLQRGGGEGPYVYGVTNMPVGFAVDPVSGRISGSFASQSAAHAASIEFDGVATDARGMVASASASIDVPAEVAVSDPTPCLTDSQGSNYGGYDCTPGLIPWVPPRNPVIGIGG